MRVVTELNVARLRDSLRTSSPIVHSLIEASLPMYVRSLHSFIVVIFLFVRHFQFCGYLGRYVHASIRCLGSANHKAKRSNGPWFSLRHLESDTSKGQRQVRTSFHFTGASIQDPIFSPSTTTREHIRLSGHLSQTK